jgi:hypothetical protein
LDLAEVLGIEIQAQRRQQVEQAGLEELRAIRQSLKSQKAWP